MRCSSSTFLVVVLTALSLMLTGCGTKRRTVVSGGKATAVVRPPSKPPVTGNTKDSNDADLVARLIDGAYSWIGTPYRYGGNERSGTDCSGFVQRLFADIAAVNLPRNSRKQAEYCDKVSKKQIQPGDLLFFDGSSVGSGIGHVGLYVGEGRMIHASTSRGVIVSGIDEAYYDRRYRQAGRVQAITYASRGHKPKKTERKPIFVPETQKTPEVTKEPIEKPELKPAKKPEPKPEKKPEPKPEKKPERTIIIQTDISALVDSAFAAMPDSVLTDWMD